LLCITQQNSIIFLRKKNENIISLKKSNNYDKKDLIELLPNELCINILQLTNQLFISCNITNSKYETVRSLDDFNIEYIGKFYF